MKKKILFVMISLFLIHTTSVNAASLNVTASQTSVTKGGSVTVTVKANDLTGKFSITSSNSNVLSGGTSSVWLENETKTYKFSAMGNVYIYFCNVGYLDIKSNKNGKEKYNRFYDVANKSCYWNINTYCKYNISACNNKTHL